MKFWLPLLLVSCPAYAAVHRQVAQDLLEPALVSPTYVNELPAAVEVTPSVFRPAAEPIVSGTSVSASVAVSGSTAASPTTLGMAAPQQCLSGLRVISEMALVGYDANPNRAFMRVASHAAVAEPYAANGVPPNLQGLAGAIDDLPFNGAAVKEIQQGFAITRTACAVMAKPQ